MSTVCPGTKNVAFIRSRSSSSRMRWHPPAPNSPREIRLGDSPKAPDPSEIASKSNVRQTVIQAGPLSSVGIPCSSISNA